MSMKNTLSFFLKNLRYQNGKERLSVMANKLDVSASYLSSVENGKKPMSDKLYQLIVTRYQLNKNESIELNTLRHLESKNLNVNTQELDDQKKEIVVKFLSNLDSLDDEDIKEINYLINKHK